jgi:hypothetical protein
MAPILSTFAQAWYRHFVGLVPRVPRDLWIIYNRGDPLTSSPTTCPNNVPENLCNILVKRRKRITDIFKAYACLDTNQSDTEYRYLLKMTLVLLRHFSQKGAFCVTSSGVMVIIIATRVLFNNTVSTHWLHSAKWGKGKMTVDYEAILTGS